MVAPIVSYETVVVKLHYLNYVVVEVPPHILDRLPGKMEKGNYNQRLIIRLDGNVSWQCGIIAMGEGSGCIPVNATRLKALKKTIGDDVLVELSRDDSEFGVEVAEELAAYWAQEPVSYSRFMDLKPSMQRYILQYVIGAKSTEKRLERTVLLMRNLVRSAPGKETFRELLGK